MRHKQKYPARGQRTHTNAKTNINYNNFLVTNFNYSHAKNTKNLIITIFLEQ